MPPGPRLIVDYLTERQPSMDYNSLQGLSRILASNFWADLERHHPGIDSLALAPEVARRGSHAWPPGPSAAASPTERSPRPASPGRTRRPS